MKSSRPIWYILFICTKGKTITGVQVFPLRKIFENSLKLAQIFKRGQLKRTFKFDEQNNSLIARSFIRLLIYYMTEEMSNAHLSIYTPVLSIKNTFFQPYYIK